MRIQLQPDEVEPLTFSAAELPMASTTTLGDVAFYISFSFFHTNLSSIMLSLLLFTLIIQH